MLVLFALASSEQVLKLQTDVLNIPIQNSIWLFDNISEAKEKEREHIEARQRERQRVRAKKRERERNRKLTKERERKKERESTLKQDRERDRE